MNLTYKAFQRFLKRLLFARKKAKSIGFKLLVLVLAVSSLFVILQTIIQLNNDYRVGLGEIDRQFEQLELSYNASLSRSIWEVNQAQIESILVGMLIIPDVVHISVSELVEDSPDGKRLLAEVGVLPGSSFVRKSMPVMFESRGKKNQVGVFHVTISLNKLYNGLYGTALFILLFQMVKTFLMSAFILAIFHFLVTRHLVSMASFSRNTSTENLDEFLILDRKTISEEDEISAMCDALNETKNNLNNLIKSNQKSMTMQIELSQKEEKEKIQEQFSKQIEAKATMLAKSNNELESTISKLKKTQDQLITSEKMAALGGMVKGVAHELNTPIGLSITGISHIQNDAIRLKTLLAKNKMKKSDLEEFLGSTVDLSKSIGVGLDKAASLIKSFKLVSVEQHEELKQHFDVRNNLEDILQSVRHSVKGKNINVINKIEENIELCSFPGVFYQVYTNLINNSVLHAFEGRDQGEMIISAVFEDNNLLMSVADNGCGMSEEVVKQVFDPFFTTKRANGGTGLGMNIIYNLVNEKLYGDIKIESKVGVGTTVSLKVPNLAESI
jgi:signal transduction histidine kinase